MASELSLTIPIYNEEEIIEETIKNLVEEFKKQKINYELVLVNHGSTDNTEEILKKLNKKNKKLRVHNLKKNLGYGGGIMYGFEHSKGKFIGWTCADEEVSAEDVYRIYKILKEKNVYVAKAQRIKRTDGLFRKFTSFVFNALVVIRFNLHLKDVNGFPVFLKKEIYKEVKPQEKEYLFNLNLLRNIKRKKYKIIEIPVIHQKRKTGKSFMKLSRVFKMAFGLLKYSV